MEIIARKKGDLWIIYLITAILGIGIIFLNKESMILMLVGAVITIIFIGILIDYLLIPKKIIQIREDGKILFSKKKVFLWHELKNVSYRRFSAKGIQYQWGKIMVQTTRGTFSYRYVDECEKVAQELIKRIKENDCVEK